MSTNEDEYRKVFSYALNRASSREYSTRELRNKLYLYVDKHAFETIDETIIEGIIARLTAERFVSDRRFTEAFVNCYKAKLGPEEIIRRLKAKGISEALIDEYSETLYDNTLERAYALWEKKFGVLPTDDKSRRQQVVFLARKGFSFDLIYRLFDMIKHHDGMHWDEE